MKAFNVLALFYVFVSVTLAVPVPVRQGKQRAVDTPSPPPTPPPATPDHSRPGSPVPNAPLDHPPLPGRSGHHTVNGLTTIHYGDDDLPGHMRHVQRNQALHPGNREPMELAHHTDTNRKDALHGIPTKDGKVRDEKHPNMFHNPNHGTTTTVEYRDPHESSKEGGLLSGAKAAILTSNNGKPGKGQIRANPGWLPLDPSQRRGHEAPARLNSQTHNGQAPHHVPKKPKAKGQPAPDHPKGKGYTPTTGTMELRRRPDKDAPIPKTPAPKKTKGGPTNLQQGTPPKPAGHVFRGTSESSSHRASHHGAPAPPSNSHERHPPRPQNQAHHERMQKEAKEKAAKGHGGSSQTHHDAKKDSGKHLTNLEKFNKAMGPPRAGNGHGHSVEAPARLGSHQPSTHNHGPSTAHHGPSTAHHGPSTSHHGPSTSHHGPSTPHHGASTSHPPAHGHPAPHRQLPLRGAPPETPTPKGKPKSKKK